jgi:hypothetical protein
LSQKQFRKAIEASYVCSLMHKKSAKAMMMHDNLRFVIELHICLLRLKLYKQRVGTNIAHAFHPYEWVHLPCASPIYKIFSIVSRKSEVRICMLWINFKNVEPHNDIDLDKLMIIIDKL